MTTTEVSEISYLQAKDEAFQRNMSILNAINDVRKHGDATSVSKNSK